MPQAPKYAQPNASSFDPWQYLANKYTAAKQEISRHPLRSAAETIKFLVPGIGFISNLDTSQAPSGALESTEAVVNPAILAPGELRTWNAIKQLARDTSRDKLTGTNIWNHIAEQLAAKGVPETTAKWELSNIIGGKGMATDLSEFGKNELLKSVEKQPLPETQFSPVSGGKQPENWMAEMLERERSEAAQKDINAFKAQKEAERKQEWAQTETSRRTPIDTNFEYLTAVPGEKHPSSPSEPVGQLTEIVNPALKKIKPSASPELKDLLIDYANGVIDERELGFSAERLDPDKHKIFGALEDAHSEAESKWAQENKLTASDEGDGSYVDSQGQDWGYFEPSSHAGDIAEEFGKNIINEHSYLGLTPKEHRQQLYNDWARQREQQDWAMRRQREQSYENWLEENKKPRLEESPPKASTTEEPED